MFVGRPSPTINAGIPQDCLRSSGASASNQEMLNLPTCITNNNDNDFEDNPPVQPKRQVCERVIIRGGNSSPSIAIQNQGISRSTSSMDDNDDNDYVDLTDLHSLRRYRDPEHRQAEEERDMF